MQIRAIILASMSKKNGAELPPARLLAYNPAMASRSASAGAQKTARSGARPWTKGRGPRPVRPRGGRCRTGRRAGDAWTEAGYVLRAAADPSAWPAHGAVSGNPGG